MNFPVLRPLGLAALLLVGQPGPYSLVLPAAGQAAPVEDKVYTYVEQMPRLPGGGGMAAIVAAVQQRVVLPAHSPAASRRVFARFTIGKQGQVESAEIVQGTNPTLDAAVLAAVQKLPTFEPGRQNGQPVRVSFTVAISPPGLAVTPGLDSLPDLAATPEPDSPELPAQEDADAIETRTLLVGEAERRSGEADSTFVRRVLPLSFAASKDLLAAAWRPGGYGKQLFFSMPSRSDSNEQGSDLVVLDPFYEDTYALHIFTIPALTGFIIPSQGKATALTAIFFADVNQDGQKELLVLSQGSQLEPEGFKTYYQTQVFQYLGLTSTGRPQYYEDSAQRENFHGLATVAEVRQALARHPQHPAAKPAAKQLTKPK